MIRELDQLLRENHEVSAAVTNHAPGQVAVAQKEASELTSAAAEKQREADTKKSCYFEAHDQAVEESISSEGPA